MEQLLSQLPLSARIPTLAKAVADCRSRKQQVADEEAVYLDLLAQAEAAVAGKAPGWEGVALSGLIAPDSNPYDPSSLPPADAAGDTEGALGKSAGDPSPAGSESSPKSHSRHARK